MGTRLAIIVGVGLITCATLVAADFWETKAFTTWSEEEVVTLLTDSPWSRVAWVHTPHAALATRVGGLSGGVVGAGVGSRGGIGAGGGGVAGDGAGNLGGGTFMAPPHRTRLTVRWASALPVRQAVLRRSQSAGADVPRDMAEPRDRVEPFYRVAVSGIPVELSETVTSLNDVLQATTLKAGRRLVLSPVDIRLRYEDDLLVIESHFLKADPIVLEDREVEFVTKLGPTQIKRTFTLKDMIMHGALRL